VYATAAGADIFATITPVRAGELVPALLAGLAFFGVNNLAVAVVISLHTGAGWAAILREDVRAQGLAAGILLGLAPVAALVVTQAPVMLPLLLLPLVGVHRSAWITARRQHEAMHDALTGLPNRMLFQRLTAQAIAEEHEAGGSLGVVLLDLDHFREVNDTLGHQVGDDVLLEVARRVTAALPAGLTVARLGGDEFAVLVPGGEPEVAGLARRLATRLREPVVTENARMGVQASIGIALFPEHARDADTLLKRADIALYRAKRTRGETETYRPEIDEHTVLRLNLLGDLHKAVDNEEFELLFQPQVDGLNGDVVGVEALMRWRHPDYGTISPEIFIPLAENTGLIGSLSRRALETAVTTLGLLRTAGHDLSMAVNVSARTLSDLDLPRWISRALLVSSVPPSRLTIEVTESTITADPQRAIQVLHELRELGVLLSVDDFGTGYSSLSYLRQLQPDELKVDRSFVGAMCRDGDSAVIVRSTVELGHALGLDVVAEGVGGPGHLRRPRRHGLRPHAGLPHRAADEPGRPEGVAGHGRDPRRPGARRADAAGRGPGPGAAAVPRAGHPGPGVAAVAGGLTARSTRPLSPRSAAAPGAPGRRRRRPGTARPARRPPRGGRCSASAP
jgi:diguanylate cyclase (GGDEF)-like protein